MKNFMRTKFQEMTIGQSFVWLVLYMIFIVIVMVAMMVVPQHAEEIWDSIEGFFLRIKEKFLMKRTKKEEEAEVFEF